MPTSKLALGTVQFGLNYGVSNTVGQTPPAEASAILDFAREKGIDTLDTAQAYGTSEQVLGEYLQRTGTRFRVVSKLPADFSEVEASLSDTLARLRVEVLYGYLYHNFDAFKKRPESLETLYRLRDEGKAAKIGFSLYKVEELDFLLERKIRFDLVQVPYSVFDRRFASRFEALKRLGAEIHVRSAFLQGLAFLDPETMHPFFKPVSGQIKRLRETAANSGLTVADICLLWCVRNELIDRVVVGVNTKANLADNCASLSRNIPAGAAGALEGIEIADERYLLPYLWKTT